MSVSVGVGCGCECGGMSENVRERSDRQTVVRFVYFFLFFLLQAPTVENGTWKQFFLERCFLNVLNFYKFFFKNIKKEQFLDFPITYF